MKQPRTRTATEPRKCVAVMRRTSWLLVFLALCSLLVVGTTAAFAHATLLSSDPADGAVLRDAPSHFVLTFNEPVTPLVIRLVEPDGSATALSAHPLEDGGLAIDAPSSDSGRAPMHSAGASSLTDGHPVGGSLIFSIGAASPGALPDVANIVDWPLRLSIWAARVLVYVGLFAGVGGLFHAAYLGPVASPARKVQAGILCIALIALAVSVGLQGLDALGVPLAGLGEPLVWRTGFGGSYATAVLLAGLALLIGLIGMRVQQVSILRTLAVVALAAVGGALASTGHASAAHPQWLTRSVRIPARDRYRCLDRRAATAGIFAAPRRQSVLRRAEPVLAPRSCRRRASGRDRHRSGGNPDRTADGSLDDRLRAGISGKARAARLPLRPCGVQPLAADGAGRSRRSASGAEPRALHQDGNGDSARDPLRRRCLAVHAAATRARGGGGAPRIGASANRAGNGRRHPHPWPGGNRERLDCHHGGRLRSPRRGGGDPHPVEPNRPRTSHRSGRRRQNPATGAGGSKG